jgi:hypothetical protein
MTENDSKQKSFFAQHPNWTLFFALVVANVLSYLGLLNSSFAGTAFGVILFLLAIVLVFAAEIWNIRQKGHSLLNLLWNFIPYAGFAMILLLDYKLVAIAVTAPDKVKIGSSFQLIATGTRLDGKTKKIQSAAWESSNPNIAVVNADGVVTVKSPGSCELSVTSDGVTCKTMIFAVAEA